MYFLYSTKTGHTSIGYQGRRLAAQVPTGVFECNRGCACDRRRCVNRVVQQGVSLRLQLFKTALGTGWGVRCLDEVPLGSFVSTYTGALMAEHEADAHCSAHGDEYLAELDFAHVLLAARKRTLLKEATLSIDEFKNGNEGGDEDQDQDQELPDVGENNNTSLVQTKKKQKRRQRRIHELDKGGDMLVPPSTVATRPDSTNSSPQSCSPSSGS